MVLDRPNAFAATGVPPTITAQPQPQTVFLGANVNLRVAATPSVGLRYVWRFFGTNLPADVPGQFTPLLTLREVTTNASGPYSVVVSNAFGAVTSQTAVVTVNQPFGFAVGYINLTVPPGYSLFTHQLIPELTNQTVAGQLPFVRDGVSLFKADGTGFTANNFLDGWSDTEMTLTLGEGWFFHNPATEPTLVTLAGGVVAGRVINRLPAGLSISANIIPQAGLLSTWLSFPRTVGAQVFLFDRPSLGYLAHEIGDLEWFPTEPSVAVGEAFWVWEPAPQDWVREFSRIPLAVPSITYLIVHPALGSETGEINFFTYHPDTAFGRVLDFDGVTPLDSEFAGQLYAGVADDEHALVPIGRPQLFRDGAGAGYIRGSTLKLPGLRGGDRVFLQLRVWEKCAGRTYEHAMANGSAAGRSPVFSAIAHATIENGGPGLPPPNANTFASFAIAPGQEAPFRLGQVQYNGSEMELCFTTQPGRIYCLQKSLSCEEPMEWSPVPGAQHVIGTGHVAKVTDTVSRQCFYRLCPAP
jgi:hypothetical protein